jgi:hypothetical protein
LCVRRHQADVDQVWKILEVHDDNGKHTNSIVMGKVLHLL